MVKNIVFVLLILAAPFAVVKEASAICPSTDLSPTGVGKSLWQKQPLFVRDSTPYVVREDGIYNTEDWYYFRGYEKVGEFIEQGVPSNAKALFARSDLVKVCVNSQDYRVNYCQEPGYVYGVCVGKGIQIWVKNGYQNQITTDPVNIWDGTWSKVVMNMNNLLNINPLNKKIDYADYTSINRYSLDVWALYGLD